jgi:atrial natriuretic peptide receptor A
MPQNELEGFINFHFSYPICSGSISPGLAADMHFRDDVIAYIGPACAFALEPVARLAAYWNIPIITGMGDQVNI